MHTSRTTPSGRASAPRRGGKSVLALLAGATLMLSACASDQPSEDQPTRLRVGLVSLSTSDSLDPAKATTVGGYAIARQLFDTLVEYGTDGKVTNRLAESLEPGDSADTWTLTLKDAKWSDGEDVTADDVVYTFKRFFDEELPPANSLPFLTADGVEKVDDTTVRFNLEYPTVVLPDALTSPTMAIVPEGFDPEKPIGSGPFVLANHDPGSRVSFDANDEYFQDGQPGVDTLEFISFPDSNAMVNALVGGQIDVASSMDPSLVPVVEAGGDGYKVFNYPTSGTLTWQMNVAQKPFDDVKVRQALRLAVDRQQIIDQVYDGYATLGNDIFSPFDEGYDDGLPQRERDIEQAKSLLAEAGYPDGVDVELTAAPIQPTADRQNEVLVQQAAEAGFRITFNKVDAATYYGDAYGTYPLSLSFWGQLSIFDQAAFTIVNDAPYNATKWQDDEYNSLYEQAVRTVDDDERIDLVHQMQRIEYERGAYVVAIFVDNISAYSAKVSGYQPYPNADGPSGYNFKDMTVKE
ncbi:ABC transporter substrate-binding protein [Ruicaihuangia caeni]|uniref:ABC transporter substrate-binding protein n=1 Tax=Ruicaihuangia caeni TaxID=3042517 RepID=A0AAW6T8P6_9MICO|nr:ABC transporter substrate-binding protein [Klugiella sp. YN-L-19]MDI2098728.1 ABC transporter substrate-binding protein [Klugiella sp. YN-L-19]